MRPDQSIAGSATESVVNTVAGFLISWAATPFILLAFGYRAGAGKSLAIVAVYTALSFARTFLVRRFFEWRLCRGAP